MKGAAWGREKDLCTIQCLGALLFFYICFHLPFLFLLLESIPWLELTFVRPILHGSLLFFLFHLRSHLFQYLASRHFFFLGALASIDVRYHFWGRRFRWQEKEKSFKKVTTHLFFVGRCLFLVNITLENGSWKRASFYKRFSV